MACYCPGTRIRTGHGDVPIEAIGIGDRVVTLSGALAPVKWIGRRAYAARFARGRPGVAPVRIRAGALGDGVPARDLYVSPRHAMYVDGVLIPAELLVNGTTITQPRPSGDVAYVHIELASHDVIWAEGAPSETFLDDGSRGMFHNAAEYAARYPGERAGAARYCAKRVVDGPEVEAARRRFAGRVAA